MQKYYEESKLLLLFFSSSAEEYSEVVFLQSAICRNIVVHMISKSITTTVLSASTWGTVVKQKSFFTKFEFFSGKTFS